MQPRAPKARSPNLAFDGLGQPIVLANGELPSLQLKPLLSLGRSLGLVCPFLKRGYSPSEYFLLLLDAQFGKSPRREPPWSPNGVTTVPGVSTERVSQLQDKPLRQVSEGTHREGNGAALENSVRVCARVVW